MHKCQSTFSVVSKVWSLAKQFDPTGLADPAEKIVKALDSVFGNGPGKIGPRALIANKELDGAVVGGTERCFIAPAPTRRPARIRFTKRSGKADFELDVCAIREDGTHTELASLRLDGKMADGASREVNVPAHVVPVIRLDSKDALKQISYSVKLVA